MSDALNIQASLRLRVSELTAQRGALLKQVADVDSELSRLSHAYAALYGKAKGDGRPSLISLVREAFADGRVFSARNALAVIPCMRPTMETTLSREGKLGVRLQTVSVGRYRVVNGGVQA